LHRLYSQRTGVLDTKLEQRIDALEEQLYGPTMPYCMQYMVRWLDEVHARSGLGMEGVAPLSYDTIAKWAMLTGRDPMPHEVDALLMLDAVRRNPDTVDLTDNDHG
jgi:hypothetical protein